MTVTVKMLIAIVVSTATICSTVLMSFNDLKSELKDNIRSVENDNRIRDLKFENLKLEVERTQIGLERFKEEYRRDRDSDAR